MRLFSYFLLIVLISALNVSAQLKGVPLPETDIYKVTKTTCGIVNEKIFSGKILKTGNFLSFKKKINVFNKRLKTADTDTAEMLTKKIKNLKKRKKKADLVCNALMENSPLPNAVIADSTTSPDGFVDPTVESVHFVFCPASYEFDTVWGTGIYTADSAVCSAGQHAGLIAQQSGGNLIVKIKPGAESYIGSIANGIETYDWGVWSLSFVFLDPRTGMELF